ncbi:CCCH zinc finger and RRM domain-containing protein [Metarhizium album ARSEF 1941]|uniref:CCCH zinc finger and RRM domain-containing protein n=1 Tax=Metarhizium album (strain ARSEF 1941) TaxID=1081103 RepID=A0A0B2WWJ5_METAS|nr:CCCH zinc finger and RRM domain-containing protein [Metarhizium album ARSEF 1941]KHN97989.1 CCCH zinc finger and RRM domain-containing protein [Metarhizium album ARSEF 1941]
MLFPEADAPLLKAWIVKRIENTSDADSDVLAEYVIALLKHDGDKESVRKLCEQEIPDFLTEEPQAFLDDVFQAIAYKSYLPGAQPAPKLAELHASSQKKSPESSRKRRFDESGPSDDRERNRSPGGRAFKQLRKGRRGREDRADRNANAYGMMMIPPFNPNNPMEAMMQMQAMGLPWPGMPGQQGWGVGGGAVGRGAQRRKGRGRCRDFDTKGFCARGNTCVFDHGDGHDEEDEEYDPVNVVIQPLNLEAPSRGRKTKRGGRKGGSRAPFSAEGAVNDRSKSTIVIENIPEEHFSEDKVREFFSQFGNIVEVSMQPYKHLAIVKYHKWAAANDAYRSPKVIFDNRFVKVFWYKDEGDKLPASVPNGSSLAPGSGPDEMDAEPELDMEEFQRKQEEAQKQHREREDKRSELEKKRLDLEKQQQELLAKHQAESERLRAKLAEKNSGPDTPGASGADMLRAKLAALEQEAKMLGIDPNAEAESSEYPPRGGHGGRGYRVRGFAPRGRGAMRGTAGRHAAYAQFSIDNRPKKLAITGVDFTPSDKDEQLRHFLLNMGEFESVDTSPSVTHVSFRDRKTAEKLYHLLHGNELPGVQGKLELTWVNSPLPPVAPKKSAHEDSGIVTPGDAMAGMDDAREEGKPRDKERDADAAAPVNMDYEVGDYGWE